MPFKISIYCCHYLFSEIIKTSLEVEDLGVNTIINNYTDINLAVNTDADLLIVDYNFLSSGLFKISAEQSARIILLETKCNKPIDNTDINDYISKGIAGVLTYNSSPEEFINAVKNVISGGLWLGLNKIPKNSNRRNTRHKQTTISLTKREKEVARMVCKGFSNKEIKRELEISEQSVKAHLSKIYKKVGVNDRLQLALHSMKTSHSILHNNQ